MKSDREAIKRLERRLNHLDQRKGGSYDITEAKALRIAIMRIKQFQLIQKFYIEHGWRFEAPIIKDLFKSMKQIEIAEEVHSQSSLTSQPRSSQLELWPGRIYKTKSGDIAEFARMGGTGLAVFHPPGEPDMQSCFAIDPSKVEREATPEEIRSIGADPDKYNDYHSANNLNPSQSTRAKPSS